MHDTPLPAPYAFEHAAQLSDAGWTVTVKLHRAGALVDTLSETRPSRAGAFAALRALEGRLALRNGLVDPEPPPASAAPVPPIGVVVRYDHPSWGVCRGEVLYLGDDGVGLAHPRHEGPVALVQDLSPLGGREYWPIAQLAWDGRPEAAAATEDITPTSDSSLCDVAREALHALGGAPPTDPRRALPPVAWTRPAPPDPWRAPRLVQPEPPEDEPPTPPAPAAALRKPTDPACTCPDCAALTLPRHLLCAACDAAGCSQLRGRCAALDAGPRGGGREVRDPRGRLVGRVRSPVIASLLNAALRSAAAA